MVVVGSLSFTPKHSSQSLLLSAAGMLLLLAERERIHFLCKPSHKATWPARSPLTAKYRLPSSLPEPASRGHSKATSAAVGRGKKPPSLCLGSSTEAARSVEWVIGR